MIAILFHPWYSYGVVDFPRCDELPRSAHIFCSVHKNTYDRREFFGRNQSPYGFGFVPGAAEQYYHRDRSVVTTQKAPRLYACGALFDNTIAILWMTSTRFRRVLLFCDYARRASRRRLPVLRGLRLIACATQPPAAAQTARFTSASRSFRSAMLRPNVSARSCMTSAAC